MPGDNELDRLRAIARQLRRNIVKVTRAAGSGHPSSAASAVELMTVLFFGGVLRYDVSRPDHPNNDRSSRRGTRRRSSTHFGRRRVR
jgi:transketolase